jgi:mono/diheme cytochrome c family protein
MHGLSVFGASAGRRGRWARILLLACAAAGPLCGCGAGARTQSAATSSSEAQFTAPLTPEQHLVERGAHLFVADGCSGCHAIGAGSGVGPSFATPGASRLTLTDGRRVPVDERFLREALLNPRATELKGYPLAPMLAAVQRLHLSDHPTDVAALAAFIEQIGPEDG